MSPVITGFSAPLLQHDQVITIMGSGFGTKSPVTPLIWDDCMHGQPITARWTGYFPTRAVDASFVSHPEWNLDYRTITQGVAMPHAFTTKYLCAHYGPEQHASGIPNYDGFAGANIGVWKNVFGKVKPWSFYASWRRRTHPNWQINTGANNFKLIDYGSQSEPYAGSGVNAGSYYHSYNYPGASTDLTVSSLINQIGGAAGPHLTILEPDEVIAYGFQNVNNINGITYGPGGPLEFQQWVQAEWVQRSDDVNGHVTFYWGGQQGWPEPNKMPPGKTTYDGFPSDRIPDAQLTVPNRRMIGIAGYNNDFGVDNWRYLCDLYLDDTWSRVCIGNSNVYSSCTVREMQIPTSWSDTVLQATIKQNTLSSLNGSYLYVVDANGVVSNGFLLSGAPPVNNSLTGLQEARGMAISGLQGAHEALASGVVLPAGALIPKRFPSHRRR